MPASPPAALSGETAAPTRPYARGLPQRCPPSRTLVSLALPSQKQNVRRFREAAALCLAPHGLQAVEDDVGIVVDELAANAVSATGHMFSVCMVLGRAEDVIVVEMHDNSPRVPVLKVKPRMVGDGSERFDLDGFLAAFGCENGRGLQIVDSLCGHCWGYDKYPQHAHYPGSQRPGPGAFLKRVWAVVPMKDAA